MGANEIQVGGTHYKTDYEHWDWVEDLCLPYLEAQTTRYIMRARKKNGVEDLKKSIHYVDKMLELLQRRHPLSQRNLEATLLFCSKNELTEEESRIIRLIAHWRGKEDLILAKKLICTMVDQNFENLCTRLHGGLIGAPQFVEEATDLGISESAVQEELRKARISLDIGIPIGMDSHGERNR